MGPLDLDQIIEEMQAGMPLDMTQAEQGHLMHLFDPCAAAEIEGAIDDLIDERLRGDYGVRLEPQYMFDPHYDDPPAECIFILFGG